MKIIEIITEAKKKTSIEFRKLKKTKNSVVEAYSAQSSPNIDANDKLGRGVLAPGGMLKKLKADLRYAEEAATSIAKVNRLKAEIAKLEAPQADPKYTDTKAGVLKFFENPKEVDKRFSKSLDLPNCDIFPDPQVKGVWGIDSMKTGSRVIVYLAGYEDVMGNPRMFNDFEEGGMPFKTIREFIRHGKVNRKQLEVWEKLGNLEPGDLVKLDKEFKNDEDYNGK